MSIARDAEAQGKRRQWVRTWLIRGGLALTCLLILLAAEYLRRVSVQHAAVSDLKHRRVFVSYEAFDTQGNTKHAERPMWLRDLLENDWLGSPTTLNAEPNAARIDKEGLGQIAKLRYVKHVMLGRTAIRGQDLDALKPLRNLQFLSLTAAEIGNADLVRLQNFPRLRGLGLSHTAVSDTGIDEISKLRSLEIVDLRQTLVTTSGVQKLQAALPRAKIHWSPSPSIEHWRACASISRAGGSINDLGTKGIYVSITRHPIPKYGEIEWRGSSDDVMGIENIAGLTSLSIESDLLGNDKGNMLANCQKLTSLVINGTSVNDKDVAEVVAARPNLTRLYVERSPVTDEGLSQIRLLQGLESLSLGNTAVTDAGMESIAELEQLKSLSLDRTSVGDLGLERLSNLTNLEYISLNHCPITDAGLEHLHGKARLKNVTIHGNPRVTQVGIERLKSAVPGLTVYHSP